MMRGCIYKVHNNEGNNNDEFYETHKVLAYKALP
jgi:hypothetical protein